MPDKREHRGAHPDDAKLFATDKITCLRTALADYSLLLTKGYAQTGALKLVGDRFSLTQRQRVAVMRSSCTDEQLKLRKEKKVQITEIANQSIAIDGYNILITVEAAISGGALFKGKDGCLRDIASIHGTYRKVDETIPAFQLIGDFLRQAGVSQILWLLDSPVSNSGRLKTLMAELCEKNGWDWDIQLVQSPDKMLIETDFVVSSSDSIVLDGCKRWVNLATAIIESRLPQSWIIDLS
jgi:hypothetical protein